MNSPLRRPRSWFRSRAARFAKREWHSAALAPSRGARMKRNARLKGSPPPKRTFTRRLRRRCGMPSRSRATNSKSSWRSAASCARSPPRRRPKARRPTMAQTAAKNLIGTTVPRIDGPLKTSGTAKYSSDHNFPNMVHALPVQATVAKGRIKSMDVSDAEKMRGVLRIYRYGHVPRFYRPNGQDENAHVDETRPPFEEEVIYYNGQYVAVVFAETIEQARAAARAIRVEYESEKPNVSTDLSEGFNDKMHEVSKRGDVDAGFASAAVKVDQTYVTPIETHNPIELHSTVAVWDGERYKLYETTQSIMNHQAAMAQMLGVPKENVQIVMKFL